MAADDLIIRIRLSGANAAAADAAKVRASIDGIGSAAKRAHGGVAGFASRLNTVGTKMTATGHVMTRAFTVPFLAIAGASAKLASDFQQNMELIHTQAGATQKEVGSMSDFILHRMQGSVQGPNELAKALFRLEGQGLRGERAMKALRGASDLSMVGNANVEDTAKVLGQAYAVGIKGVGSFRHEVGLLNATVGTGDMRLQDLVDALGTGVLASAKQAGLKFQDVTEALAVFGDETKNVSGWTAQFATALHFLTSPGDKAKAALAEMGLGAHTLSNDMNKPNGLIRALKDLRGHLDALPGGPHGARAKDVIAAILPGGRGRVLTALMNKLTGPQGTTLAEKRSEQQAGVAGFGAAVATSRVLAANKMHAALAQIQKDGVEIGQKVLPMLVPLVQQITKDVTGLTNWFNHLSPGMQRAILKFGAFLALTGPLMIFLGSTARGIASIAGGLRGLAKVSFWVGDKIVTYITGGTGIGGLAKAAGGPLGKFKGMIVARLTSIGAAAGSAFAAAAGPLIVVGIAAYVFSHRKQIMDAVQGKPGQKGNAHLPGFLQQVWDLPTKNSPKFHGIAPPSIVLPTLHPHGHVTSPGKRPLRAHPNRSPRAIMPALGLADGGDIVLHSHLHLDGKELFTTVDRYARNRRNRG